jgi:hypothetical protein
MKILHCNKCNDLIELQHEYRECRCGAVSGFYTSYENMIYSGDADVIGIDNKDFYKSLENVPLDGKGVYFQAYAIPYYCDSAIKVPNSLAVYHKTKDYPLAKGYQSAWTDKITRVRVKNPFLKLFYLMFKRWIFVSVKEDEVVVAKEDEELTKYDEQIYSLSTSQLASIYAYSYYYGVLEGTKKTKKDKEAAWELSKLFAMHTEHWTQDKSYALPLDTKKKV